MTIIQAILLGIIQGITEFFPVSSSGHLELFQHLFGLEDIEQHLFFDLVCHLGTVAAVIAVYFRELKELLTERQGVLAQIAVALLPLFFLLPFMGTIEKIFGQPQYLGYFFLATALLLYAGERLQSRLALSPYAAAAVVGLFQMLAIFPGLSRSGATISSARFAGWERSQAVRFSFLLAIPTILGGVALQSLKLIKGSASLELPMSHYLAGFLFSAVVGYYALRFLVSLASRRSLTPFAWYCAAIGIVSLLYFHSLP